MYGGENMGKVEYSIIDMIESLTLLSKRVCVFEKKANIEHGEEIVEKIEECEKKFLTIKKNMVELIESQVKKEKYIEAIITNNGFLINKEKDIDG